MGSRTNEELTNEPISILPSTPQTTQPYNPTQLQKEEADDDEFDENDENDDDDDEPVILDSQPSDVSQAKASVVSGEGKANSDRVAQQLDDSEANARQSTSDMMVTEKSIKSGYLYKKGEHRRNWKKRWFVLRHNGLSYYKNEKEYELLNIINMDEITTIAPVLMKRHEFVFGIVTRRRSYYIHALSNAEIESWMNVLRETHRQCESNLRKMSYPSINPINAIDTHQGIVARASVSSPVNESALFNEGVPTAFNADQSVAEAIDVTSETTNAYVAYSSKRVSFTDSAKPASIPRTVEPLEPVNTTKPLPPAPIPIPPRPVQPGYEERERRDRMLPTRDEVVSPLLASNEETKRVAASELNAIVASSYDSAGVEHEETVSGPGGYTSQSNDEDEDEAEEYTSPVYTPIQKPAEMAGDEVSGSEEPLRLSQHQFELVTHTEQDSQIVYQGYLHKLKKSYPKRTWKLRWFVLRNNGNLTCYKDESEYEVLSIAPLVKCLDIIDVDPPKVGGRNVSGVVSGSSYASSGVSYSSTPPHASPIQTTSPQQDPQSGRNSKTANARRKNTNGFDELTCYFKVVLPKGSWVLAAPNQEIERAWVNALHGVHSRIHGTVTY